jgi:uncharacterized protein
VIGYLDTSAFIPLIVVEPSSAACRRFWDDADAVVCTRLLYVEAAAALAQARRMARLTASAHRAALRRLDRLWEQVEIAEVDQIVVERAAALAHRFDLRCYDAMHCATAAQLAEQDLAAATGDKRLLDAWAELGVATFDTNAPATAN